jgi:hypothetical protein
VWLPVPWNIQAVAGANPKPLEGRNSFMFHS